MRVAELSEQLVGQRLARTVYGPGGVPLLTAGTRLTPAYVRALLEKGYRRVYVENPLAPDVVVDEAVNEATRVRAVETVRQVWRRVRAGESPPLELAARVVDELLDELHGAGETVFSLSTLRSLDEYSFYHSVQVCVLALVAAAALGLARPQLRELGVGALLHDIGKVRVPPEILRKPGPLTPEEFELVKRHTVFGFEILIPRFDLSARSAHVAYQHHERLDGSGYPRGLRGRQIHPFARVVAVADVYDALTADRPYRPALAAHEAAAQLRAEAGPRLEARAVEALLRRLALYPNGSWVRLATGEVGVVVRQGRRPEHPVVRALFAADGTPLPPAELCAGEDGAPAVAAVLPAPPLAARVSSA